MGLFSKKKDSPPPPPPPPVAPPPPAEGKTGTETVDLKLNLPNVFAFAQDETKAKGLARKAVPTAAEESQTRRRRGRILLVETDAEICRLLSRLFQYEGYDVQTASCLAEARELIKETPAQFLIARRTCVPVNLQTEIALRELRAKTDVRIVDEFSDLMLGQVVDYESLAQSALGVTDLLLSLLEGAYLGHRGHAHNVAKYCRLVGQRLGLKRRDLDALTLAAALHDLGPLETQHRISEALTPGHALVPPDLQSTLDLLANIPFPYAINDLLAGTAETTGAGAAGNGTAPPPLGARILRTVEAYDTLRRSGQEEFQDEERVFDWLRRQPTGTFDTDALETLIHIRKHERAISAMNIFWAAVLLVDPRPQDLQLLRLRLENDDYHVHIAKTLAEALQKLRTEQLTLVLTEYTLDRPGDGLELLRTVKNDPALRHIPVIVHAPASTDLVKQALELGAEDWYPKPHNVEIAAMKLQRVIHRVHANPAAAGEGVQGNLREMGIIEMVQILGAGGRSVQIRLERAGGAGELALQKGQIIHAAAGERRGEEAALELLTWQEGTFRIVPLKKAPPVTVTSSTDSLLLQSCLRQDQAKSPETP